MKQFNSQQFLRAQKVLAFDQCGAKHVYKGACADVNRALGQYFVFEKEDFQFLLNTQQMTVTIKVKISRLKDDKRE